MSSFAASPGEAGGRKIPVTSSEPTRQGSINEKEGTEEGAGAGAGAGAPLASNAAVEKGIDKKEVADEPKANRISVGFVAPQGNAEGLRVLRDLKCRLEGQVSFPDDAYLIREGYLTKHSGDAESRHYFILTNVALMYCNEKRKLVGGNILEHRLTMPLTAILIERISSPYMLQIYSKLKTFYVSSHVVEDITNWYDDISEFARKAKEKSGVSLTTDQCAKLKKSRDKISNCENCGKQFGMFSATHHCRNCSKVVCVGCSREKVVLPDIDERALFKVCNECARSIKNDRSYRLSDGKTFN